jgi:allantoicase
VSTTPPSSEATIPAAPWLRLPDLASARLGGEVPWANDEFFAPKESLLLPTAPVWKEDAYTDRGKWMDGWETRRRRTPGHDSCLVRLGLAGVLRGAVVDTRFFRGNFPESCSLEACAAERDAPVEALLADATEWIEVLPRSPLAGDAQNLFALDAPWRFTHLRLHIYPDGGVARLRVHGEVLPDWARIVRERGPEVDLVAVEHGGSWLLASDMFYSSPGNLLLPGRGQRMDDGWETKRRRGPGHDWVVLRLGIAGTVRRIAVDTAHFKGNYPDSCALEGCDLRAVTPLPDDPAAWPWREILPPAKLAADQQHVFDAAVDIGPVTHARFRIHPDGGVSRLRLLGEPDAAALHDAAVRRLDALPPGVAAAALADCCGAPEWQRRMRERRPFGSAAELFAAADLIWEDLDREQWLRAFAAHPEIGARAASADRAHAQGERGRAWSAGEQAGAAGAGATTLAALADCNRAYRERFGHAFIVCATGKSAEEMLALCRERLDHDADRELLVAGEEQRKITRLRLEKLLEGRA